MRKVPVKGTVHSCALPAKAKGMSAQAGALVVEVVLLDEVVLLVDVVLVEVVLLDEVVLLVVAAVVVLLVEVPASPPVPPGVTSGMQPPSASAARKRAGARIRTPP
jgi:hypothetical protein